jgi:hypothetical protein
MKRIESLNRHFMKQIFNKKTNHLFFYIQKNNLIIEKCNKSFTKQLFNKVVIKINNH